METRKYFEDLDATLILYADRILSDYEMDTIISFIRNVKKESKIYLELPIEADRFFSDRIIHTIGREELKEELKEELRDLIGP